MEARIRLRVFDVTFCNLGCKYTIVLARKPMKWVMILSNDAAKAADFVRIIKVEGRTFCVIKDNGAFYATQPRCPHAGADLSLGWCKNGKLICSFHRYQYDLNTGEGAKGQGDYLETYPLEFREDGIYIGLKERWNVFRRIFRCM